MACLSVCSQVSSLTLLEILDCLGVQQVYNIKFEHTNPCQLVSIITDVSSDRNASSSVSSRNVVQKCLPLKIKSLRSFEAPVTILTSEHVVVSPSHLNLQQYCRAKKLSHKLHFYLLSDYYTCDCVKSKTVNDVNTLKMFNSSSPVCILHALPITHFGGFTILITRLEVFVAAKFNKILSC